MRRLCERLCEGLCEGLCEEVVCTAAGAQQKKWVSN